MLIFCQVCQEPIPEGAHKCPSCQTPIDYAVLAAANVQAAQGVQYVVGGINWSAVIVGAALAIGLWHGGMQLLILAMGLDMLWFSIMVKVIAMLVGSMYAGYKSYSAELTHGLLVAGIVAAVHAALLLLVLGVALTFEVVMMDFFFIDLGIALGGAFMGARLQR